MSLALNPDGEWIFAANTNSIIFANKSPYGLFRIEVKDSVAKELKKMTQNQAGKNKKATNNLFRHDLKFFADGKELHESVKQTKLLKIFSDIIIENKMTAIDGGWIELKPNKISFAHYKNGKLISQKSDEKENFCTRRIGSFCEFELGYIDLERH